MMISRLRLKNWRNFLGIDVLLHDVSYILGPNASGKSNLLDVFRFLRDLSKERGGGLQSAVESRGGMSKLRCLHARRDTEVLIEVELSEPSDRSPRWRYLMGFQTKKGKGERVHVSREEVWRGEDCLLLRPNEADQKDSELLTQTHLEQIQANASFRDLVKFFSEITYLHLVPQLLKFSDQISGRMVEDDPFGQGFLDRLVKMPEQRRKSNLGKIKKALAAAVPQFSELEFIKDENGHPHLRALYAHHRPRAGWQTEEQFSDGTLRLIGLLWALLEGKSLLLLEEPEISLNEEIVRQLPVLMDRLQRGRKMSRQRLISTHSEAMLSNAGIDERSVILLEVGNQGSQVHPLEQAEKEALESGLSVAEVLLPKARPQRVEQLGLWK